MGEVEVSKLFQLGTSRSLWKSFTLKEADWVWILKEVPNIPSAFPLLWKLISKPTLLTSPTPGQLPSDPPLTGPPLTGSPHRWSQQDHLPAFLENGLDRSGCHPGVPHEPSEKGKFPGRDRVCLLWLPYTYMIMPTLSRLPSHTAHHLAPTLKFGLPLEPSYSQQPCPNGNSCPPLFSAAPSALRALPSLLLHQSRSSQVPSISTHLQRSTTRSDSQDLLFDTL